MSVLHLDVSKPEGLELHLYLYGKQEQVLFLEVPTLQGPELCMYVSTHRGLSCTWTCLHYRDHCSTWTCLSRWAWVAPGPVWKQKPVLIIDLSTLQYRYRGLCCTLTCLHCTGLCGSLSFLRHIQGPKLHLDVSGEKEPACAAYTTGTWVADGCVDTGEACTALGGVYFTPQHRDLRCTWVYLYKSSQCCSRIYLHYRCLCFTRNCLHTMPELHLDLCAVYCRVLCCTWTGLLYRTLSCTWMCLDNNSSLHVLLLDLSTFTTETCTALGCVYTLAPELHLDISTLQISVLHLDMFLYRSLSCAWTCFLYRGLCCTWTCPHYRVLCCT
jgi:hypothetical protein